MWSARLTTDASMRRLVAYLRPYKWQAVVSLIAVLLKAVLDVLGPFLVMVAVDRYMTLQPERAP